MKLDEIDSAILHRLQDRARMSIVDLAGQVGLSPSACSRRVEQLEAAGVIEGYHATISSKALGQTITSIVHITLDRQAGADLDAFENAVKECPHIVACFLMSGEYDYILRVTARDMTHFEHIHKNWLSTMPGVLRIHSSFAMRTVVNRASIDVTSAN